MSVVILKFFNSDPNRSFSFHLSLDTCYFLVAILQLRFMVYLCCLSMLYQWFIHALYDLQLKEINFIKNPPSIPFNIISIVHFRTLLTSCLGGLLPTYMCHSDSCESFLFTFLATHRRPIRETCRA